MASGKQCPWCSRWCLKDNACSYIFACGLDDKAFHKESGCGRSWCWDCGKKYCSLYYDPVTGVKCPDARDQHGECCARESGFKQEDYCGGGHSSHCAKRW